MKLQYLRYSVFGVIFDCEYCIMEVGDSAVCGIVPTYCPALYFCPWSDLRFRSRLKACIKVVLAILI